jgi:hypothetical protein
MTSGQQNEIPMKRTSLLLTCLIGVAVPTVGLAQPTITVEPQSQTNVAGSTLALAVEASGTLPLLYQWQKYGGFPDFHDLADRTNVTLVLTNVGSSDAGDYRVIVTNADGAITSAVARLTVLVPPAITLQPASFPTLSLGSRVSNRIAASGTAPLSYQWRLDGTNLPGETKASLVIADLELPNAGAYTAVVTNSLGSVTSAVVTLVILVSPVSPSRADIFGSGTNTFTIDFVDIGNPGNGDDRGAGGGSYSAPYGGVAYRYRMGVTEAPQEWITKATSLGMTHVTAGAWTGRRPAANITWYAAAAFVNWLNTSTGHQPAYDLTFSGSWSMKLWSSAQAWQAGGENLYRHKDAYYFLPSEDEWYKAAYHINDGVTANYWDYATGSNTIPTAVASGTGAGTVVYNQDQNSGSPATVDHNGGLSPYGTRGQNGNMIEMLECAYTAPNDSPSKDRARRGGYWYGSELYLRAVDPRGIQTMSGSYAVVGFRVASVPEPARLQTLGAGVLGIQSWKGMVFEIQASTDLDQWSTLTVVTNLNGTLEFTDPDAANHLRRFYRTVLR